MKPNNTYRDYLFVCIAYALLMGCGMGCAAKKTAEPQLHESKMAKQKEALLNQVTDAIEKAKTSGEAVDVYIDEDPEHVQEGDLVEVNYVITLPDGSLVRTNIEDVLSNPNYIKTAEYMPVDQFGPQVMLVSKSAPNDALMNAVIGMAPGEIKQVIVTPESGGVSVNPALIRKFPREKRIKRIVTLSQEDYTRRFGRQPEMEQRIFLVPYFQHQVIQFTPTDVYLEALVKDGDQKKDGLGVIDFSISGDDVILTLSPVVGAPFELNKSQGCVVSVQENMFEVDFNSPIAGKNMILDLEVISMLKASFYAKKEIEWQMEYESGIARAKESGKPIVLFLYADWCKWCRKMQADELVDPRLRILNEKAVWIKIDSGKNKEIKAKFEQKGFPLTVLINTDETVYKKLDGYTSADNLYREISTMIVKNKNGDIETEPHATSSLPNKES